MSKRRNFSFNDNLQKEFVFIKLEQNGYDNSIMPTFPLLMEAEVTSINIYITRNIRRLKDSGFS
jgi:hypothetical protein